MEIKVKAAIMAMVKRAVKKVKLEVMDLNLLIMQGIRMRVLEMELQM
jgi:hypothetical protein